MEIRTASSADVPQMLEIYRPYVLQTAISFEEQPPDEVEFAARFAQISTRYPWLVCEEKGALAGYAYASAAFSRAAYDWDADLSIYLAPQFHRRGIGAALYHALEQELAQRGYHNLYALITGSNATSIAFHTALGYQTLGVLPQSGFKFGVWHDVVWMGKRLCPPVAPSGRPKGWNNDKKDIR